MVGHPIKIILSFNKFLFVWKYKTFLHLNEENLFDAIINIAQFITNITTDRLFAPNTPPTGGTFKSYAKHTPCFLRWYKVVWTSTTLLQNFVCLLGYSIFMVKETREIIRLNANKTPSNSSKILQCSKDHRKGGYSGADLNIKHNIMWELFSL